MVLQRRQTIIGIAVIVIVVIIAGIVLARRGRADTVLARAFTRLSEAQTYQAKAELQLHFPETLRGRQRPFQEITITTDGVVARSHDNDPEFDGTLYIDARGPGNIFYVDGTLKALADDTRFYLDSMPVLLNPSGSLVKKWTGVETALLATQNKEAVLQVMHEVIAQLTYQGKKTVEGIKLHHYTGSLTSDQEANLATVFADSRNKGLYTIARLLAANNVTSLEVWVNSDTNEVSRIQAHFVRPLTDGKEADFADLSLSFTTYGVPVTIERPAAQLTVQPEVFARLFGTGEVSVLKN